MIVRPTKRPPCLSRDAVALVQQSLATGTVKALVREGAWHQDRYLRDDQIRVGSLWQRTEPAKLGLDFSAASLDFLMFVTAAEVTNDSPLPIWAPEKPVSLTIGDHFLVFSAARALRHTVLLDEWFRKGPLQENALAALFLPDHFAEVKRRPKPNFKPWMEGTGSCIIEAIQDSLANAWVASERKKGHLNRTDDMKRIGKIQDFVLTRFFDAAEKSGRRDLCRFVMQALNELLSERSQGQDWIRSLNTSGLRLAERTEIYQFASSLIRTTERLRSWRTQSQGVGYFDEGYAESQILKSLWEENSMDNVLTHADRVTQELSF